MFDRLVFFGKDLTNLEWEALKTFLSDNKGVVLTISKDKMLLFANAEVINVRKSIYETFFKHTELRKVATLVEETDVFYKFKLRTPDVVALYEASLIAYLLNAFTSVEQDESRTPQENIQQAEQPKQQFEQQTKQTKAQKNQADKQAEEELPTKQSKTSKQQEAKKQDKAQKQTKGQPENAAEKQKKSVKQAKEQSEKKPQKPSEPTKQAKNTQTVKRPKKEREVA